ncbi:MAG: hypothetical protein V4649_04355 [Bacteroidota bacterium]
MKKFSLIFLLAVCFGTLGFAQDFSFDDLARLRTVSHPSFESAAHDKGYSLDHVEYNDRCIVYRKKDNVISYCKMLDRGMHNHAHVSVKLETASRDQYEKIKREVDAKMKYLKSKTRRFTTQHYIEHIYASDDLVVHLYDISYRDDSEPYYEIEVFSIYSGH